MQEAAVDVIAELAWEVEEPEGFGWRAPSCIWFAAVGGTGEFLDY